MAQPTTAFSVHVLNADHSKGAALGGTYDDSTSIAIAISVAARWERTVAVWNETTGAIIAFVGSLDDD